MPCHIFRISVDWFVTFIGIMSSSVYRLKSRQFCIYFFFCFSNSSLLCFALYCTANTYQKQLTIIRFIYKGWSKCKFFFFFILSECICELCIHNSPIFRHETAIKCNSIKLYISKKSICRFEQINVRNNADLLNVSHRHLARSPSLHSIFSSQNEKKKLETSSLLIAKSMSSK